MQIKPLARFLSSQNLWNKLSESLEYKKTSGISHALFKTINHPYKKIEVAL